MEYIIETKKLTKRYKQVAAVDNVNLNVKKGEIYGLLGRNGAGKTTILKMILGFTNADEGEVLVFGKPMRGNEKELLHRIGAIIETPGFYPNLTATENLKIIARIRGGLKDSDIEESLNRVGLPFKDRKLYAEYSLGMKQRLGIAAAIMHDPELLILDEPINGLDPIGIAEMRSFIKELVHTSGKTVILSSHILSEIELIADTVGIIHQGKLLEERSINQCNGSLEEYFKRITGGEGIA